MMIEGGEKQSRRRRGASASQVMDDEIESARHQIVRLEDGKWRLYLHGVLVADLQGRVILFESEADALAFLEESDARAVSVDS
ncbi:MAG: hypothetical protein ACLPSF_14955 [Methylocella sp.]